MPTGVRAGLADAGRGASRRGHEQYQPHRRDQRTGVIDVRNLNLAASGGSAVIEFEATLAPVIDNGSVVLNQSQLTIGADVLLAVSDDRT